MLLSTITFDNIFSGLIGASLGIFSAWLLSWRAAIQTSKNRLRSLLLKIGKQLYYSDDAFHILDTFYDDILDALLELANRDVFWNKRRILSLGFKLLGHDTSSRARHCHAFPDRQTAMKIVEEILSFIGYSNNHYDR